MSQGNKAYPIYSEVVDLPAIDWKLCVQLANHKIAVAQEILLLVLQQLPQDLAAIQAALSQTDHTALLRCIHKLHGALCYCGLPRLKQVVAHLETTLKQSKIDTLKLRKLSADLEQEVDKVLNSPLPY